MLIMKLLVVHRTYATTTAHNNRHQHLQQQHQPVKTSQF